MGVVHDWIDPQESSDGSTTFTVHVYGENGEEAANNPLAPGGWIEITFTLNVTADGKVKVVKESSKDFASISIYSYQSNGEMNSLFQQKESGDINDLNKPAHSHMSSHMKEGAEWGCSFGNPAACGISKEQ